MPQRIFIGFFGITRALPWTIDSIETNLYAPLERAGFELVRAAHFNRPQFIQAPRSGEIGVPFEVGDLSRLKLDQQNLEPQLDANIGPILEEVLQVPFKDEDDSDGSTRRNSLHQLYSLRGLSRIFSEFDPPSFDAVILLRPDLRYLDPIPIKQLLAQLHGGSPWRRALVTEEIRLIRRYGRPEADIVVPIWQRWGGLNDRFAVATPTAAMVYMNRIAEIPNFCAQHPSFHPESLLEFTMKKNGMRVAGTWMRAQRIRSDGSIQDQDIPDPREKRIETITIPLRRTLQM